MKSFITLVSLSVSLSFLHADMLQMRDGNVVTGTFAGGTIASVRFEVAGQMKEYPVSQVAAITFSGGGEETPSQPAPVSSQMSTASTQESYASSSADSSVPAGTPLVVTLSQTLDSAKAEQGQIFTGTLVAPLTVGSTVVAPAGSKVSGTVTEVHGARRLLGRNASMSLELTTLTVNGQQYNISTSAQSENVKGQGMIKDAAGGAAKGAIFGAIANDDAGNGALGGMAASAAGGILRKPEQVIYQSGAMLSFELTQSVSL